MVAVDAATGNPVRVSGAALAGGPALTIARRRPAVGGWGGIAALLAAAGRRPDPPETWQTAGAVPAPRTDVLPAQWGIPAFYGGALSGPPYELAARTAEWQLSADAAASFRAVDRQARMAARVAPRGPALQSPGTFLSALFGATPTPRHLGIGIEVWT